MFVLPDIQAQSTDEIIAITLDLQTILLDADEVIPLLNTNNIANMSKVTVSATLPCNSSNVPDLKITGGVLGNTTDIISTSGDYVSLRGPFDTCLFEGTIDVSSAPVPALNRIFLINDGTSSVLTNLGTTITLTGIFTNSTSESTSELPSCDASHIDNGDGTCTAIFNVPLQAGWVQGDASCSTGDEGIFTTEVRVDRSKSPYLGCQRGFVEFDISTMPNSATVLDTVFKFEVNTIQNGGRQCDIWSMEYQPSTRSAVQITTYIADGTEYINNNNFCNNAVAQNLSIDLTSLADADIQTAIDANQDWFAIGIKMDDESVPGSGLGSKITSGGGTPDPTLEIRYVLP